MRFLCNGVASGATRRQASYRAKPVPSATAGRRSARADGTRGGIPAEPGQPRRPAGGRPERMARGGVWGVVPPRPALVTGFFRLLVPANPVTNVRPQPPLDALGGRLG